MEILLQPEGKTLEFKREIKKTDRFLQTVSSFANTAGGEIWIGIDDKTKSVYGIPDPLKEEERIASIIADAISPRLIPNIEIINYQSKSLLRVQIFPGSAKPYYIKSLGEDKGSYIRIGSTNRLADAALIQDMKRLQLGGCFDETPYPAVSIDDLDKDEFQKYLGAKGIAKNSMENLKLITSEASRKVPTIGGVLLFGKNRHNYFPDALIKVGIFSGTDKSKLKEFVEFQQYLPESIDRSLQYIHEQIKTEYDFTGSRRKMKYKLPPEALREALINAVVHADYSTQGTSIRVSIFADRIEIENPGILPLGLTLDDIMSGVSKVRNKVIARYFEKAGLIEQWGSGVQRIIATIEEQHLQAPLFEELGHHFRVTFYFQKQITQDVELSKNEKVLLQSLTVKPMGTKDLAKKMKLSERTIRSLLQKLQEKSLVEHTGKDPFDPNKKFLIKKS